MERREYPSFHDQLLEYYAKKKPGYVENNMVICLAHLFSLVLLQLLVVIGIHVLNLDILQYVGITNKTC